MSVGPNDESHRGPYGGAREHEYGDGKRILLPMASVTDIPAVPGELFAKFQISFYADPVDAVFKALGVA